MVMNTITHTQTRTRNLDIQDTYSNQWNWVQKFFDNSEFGLWEASVNYKPASYSSVKQRWL